MPRITAYQIRELLAFLTEQTLRFAPQSLKADLSFTNLSTSSKLGLAVKVRRYTLFYAHTVAGKLVLAADQTVDPCFMPSGEPNPEISRVIERVLSKRAPRVQDNLALTRQLRDQPDMKVEQNGDGTIQLTFEKLTPEAYARILKLVLPKMRTRFKREDPI